MEEGESVALLSRKELRKQKLMEYLVAKGKIDSNSKSACVRGDSVPKRPPSSKGIGASGKENKTVADRFGLGHTKTSSQSSVKPPRSVLGINNEVNVKDGVQTGRQGALLKRPTDTFAQPRLKPTIKKGNSALQPATTLSNNLSNTRALPSVSKPSKPDSTAGPVSVSRFRSISKTAWSCPLNTAYSRISLGCLVKTRTGLVPAVPQSLHAFSQSLARDSAPTAVPTAAAANKSRYKTTSGVVSVCKRPVASQKGLPPSAPGKTARDKGVTSTAAGVGKPKVPAKPSARPPILPPKSQTTNGLKSTRSTSSCAVPLNRAKSTARVTTFNQSDGRPTGSSTRQTFEREGHKNIPQVNTSSRVSNQLTANSCAGFRRSAPAAAANAVKEKSSIHTHTKKVHSVVNGKPSQVGLRRTVASVTVPQPPRTCQATLTTAAKTPAAKIQAKAAPNTEGAKLTAAQEERMRKLKEWREAKGISYKRPPMQVKAQVKPLSSKDEVDSLISTLDRALSDCIKMLKEGSPAAEVRAILSRLPPVSRKFTKFWICQARLMERDGNLDVLPMFKEAVGVVLEPLDELRMVVFEILKKKEGLQVSTPDRAEETSPGGQSSAETFASLLMTPKPITELISGEKGASSVIKYKVTTTPGRPSRQQQEPRRFNGQELRFLTPVRRSSRIHTVSVQHPESLRDHDLCVTSYEELLHGAPDETPLYLYVGNEALGDDASVQLLSLPPAESADHS